jgi:hypothetical protein
MDRREAMTTAPSTGPVKRLTFDFRLMAYDSPDQPDSSHPADGFIMKESTMTKLLFALAFVLPLAVAAVAMMTLPS